MSNKIQSFSRADTSSLGRWWWTVDRWVLLAVFALVFIGIVLSFAASPAIADRLKLDGFFFVKRHIFMVVPASLMMIWLSLLGPRDLRRVAALVFLAGLGFMVLTFFIGMEIKGARRWINLGGFSLQPSEFVKPAFAVLSAWMLSEGIKKPNFPGFLASLGLLGIYAVLLLLQPDLGMTLVAVSTWIGQLFIAGVSLFWFALVAIAGVLGLVGAYFFFPHVTKRIDQFLDPSSGDPKHDLYQVQQSLEAFSNGGLFGVGPGEGIIKKRVPDAHADFVFSVAGEEFGLFVCLLIVALFAFIILRTFWRLLGEQSHFSILATAGVIIQFGLQAVVNMASSLHLIPTKGMTMPFISYGGSSLLALAFAMGVVLSLTRKRPGLSEVF